jgi:hypothetical protein
VAAFDVSGALAKQFKQFIQRTPYGPELDFLQMTMLIALFDHLQITPILTWFRASGWTASARILGHQPIDRQDGSIDAAPAIRDQRGWTIGMSALLQGLKDP